MTAIEVLRQRGFVYQSTHEQELEEHLQEKRVYYIGFDPTADSLHVGSLVPIMAMVHMQKMGHFPLVLIGGGTARVGDPSGKTELRKMLDEEQLAKNELAIEQQLRQYLDFAPKQAKLLNNKDWLLSLNYINFLRDIGVHFSVNRMLTAESVKLRLEKGLSFIEFNYSLLQAYDFYILARDHNCSIQMGGQDQWGNIIAGDDLCRRKALNKQTFGLTFPLLTNAKGGKFGKSEKDNIWLDKRRTEPLSFYQFWRNTADADTAKFMKLFTFLDLEEIDYLVENNINRAKEILAYEVSAFCHGERLAASSYATAGSKFGFADKSGALKTSSKIVQVDLDKAVDMPKLLLSGEKISNMNWASLLVVAEFASSKSEARRLIKAKAVRGGEQIITNSEEAPRKELYSSGEFTLRVGKKRFKKIIVNKQIPLLKK